MDLDALLHHHFGTTEIETLDEADLEAGRERLLLAFGLERDAGRRFAMWVLLDATGDAPDPSVFEDARERRAAEDYRRGMGRVG